MRVQELLGHGCGGADPGDRKVGVGVGVHLGAVVAASAATGAEGHSSGVDGAWEKELPLELRTTSRLMAEMRSFPNVCTVKLDCLLAFFSIFPARPLLLLLWYWNLGFDALKCGGAMLLQ